MKDVITTHQLAQMLLAGKDQPVYTCDYQGDGGELMVYPVHCIDPNIIKNGTIICTGSDGLPYHSFPPMGPNDFTEAENASILDDLKAGKYRPAGDNVVPFRIIDMDSKSDILNRLHELNTHAA
ncbi:MAG: hypothetical protein ACRC9I_11550 [Acinetobacter sp.]